MSPTPHTSDTPIPAARVELYAPVASFRDPMFPGLTRCLPLPPPSTVRGMLAAATGRPTEPATFAMAAWHEGHGRDEETYHPIAADGSNPAVAGQVAEGKGGRTLRQRPFVVGVHLTLWVPEPEAERITAALRRPVWGLRLGRSQDLVHIRAIRRVVLHPTDQARVGHALAPPGTHTDPRATLLRLAETISADRLHTHFADYLWCAQPGEHQPVRGAYRDPTDDQAVWLHTPPEPQPASAELAQVWAKSAERSPLGRPELLTEHSHTVRQTATTLAQRIASPGVLATVPRFWDWVDTAALLHDAGKVAAGFQHQLRSHPPHRGAGGRRGWGERHEILSLAHVDLLTRDLDAQDRRMVAAAVACHHRSLTGPDQLGEHYGPNAQWKTKFGHNPDPPPGWPRIQVSPKRHRALLAWFAHQRGCAVPPPEPRKLWELARDAFTQVQADWQASVSAHEGLVAVLLQGALTLADHAGSAHVPLHTHMPLPPDLLSTLEEPYPHQKEAAATQGHLLLRAPTGSGKTEAGLAWAAHQLRSMPGQPRLVWVLPYRASLDAAYDRFRTNIMTPAPGQTEPDIALLHATAAHTLLTRANPSDTTEDTDNAPALAEQATAQAQVMRTLFAQRVRLATPHQLLRAAIAGPRYASVLLEQANAIMVLDELHAYDPTTFGRICAAMQLWEQLGSRIAVLSATLAPPMRQLVHESLTHHPTHIPAPHGTAPNRHHLVLDEKPLTHPDSLERISDWLTAGHSVLVLANTVATAQQLYTHLAPAAHHAWPENPNAAILLHSRFRGIDRAEIEKRIMGRYPEREPEEPARAGGLVVATQCLEVSLCLDFDRGASELAPVEALAQRAGRVNRRGRHPHSPVEFRVHDTPRHHDPDQTRHSAPYDPGALAAAWEALNRAPGPIISEQTIDEWLRLAYDTDWGRGWLHHARTARDDFARDFLTFTEPFDDRNGYADRLDERFDTVEVLWQRDEETYRDLSKQSALRAARWLIPISYGQFAKHHATRRIWRDRKLRVWVTDLPYDPTTGLELTTPTPKETIL